MKLTQNEVMQFLEQLHTSEEAMSRCETMLTQENYQALYRYLRSMRCAFLDNLHESQQRLDKLDYLIYDIKKKNESGG